MCRIKVRHRIGLHNMTAGSTRISRPKTNRQVIGGIAPSADVREFGALHHRRLDDLAAATLPQRPPPRPEPLVGHQPCGGSCHGGHTTWQCLECDAVMACRALGQRRISRWPAPASPCATASNPTDHRAPITELCQESWCSVAITSRRLRRRRTPSRPRHTAPSPATTASDPGGNERLADHMRELEVTVVGLAPPTPPRPQPTGRLGEHPVRQGRPGSIPAGLPGADQDPARGRQPRHRR
jgi:hypothetical protein